MEPINYDETEEKSGDYAEDLAATMLASTLGIEFDPAKNYDERKETYRMSGKIVKTRNIIQAARGDKTGMRTTVVAEAVFIFITNVYGIYQSGLNGWHCLNRFFTCPPAMPHAGRIPGCLDSFPSSSMGTRRKLTKKEVFTG
ncbi:MAG: speA [Candidatus Brocadiaceae bacterium]|nr:speA [Candidatus Brocadiaceae bacterium]